MNEPPSTAYFDTGVFVTPILKNRKDEVVAECIEWQRRIRAGEVTGTTSLLTWDEICHVVRKSISAEDAAAIGRAFLRLENLKFLSVDSTVIEVAQIILDRWRTKPRDSIHASSAILSAGGVIVTLDVNKSDYRRIVKDDGSQVLDIIEVQ